ncbi:contact-dependent growth inhibition system immunity protein [Streptomyces sp. NPDC038707]|uniref:contact-dependent growth inhibition system immunity protein n=1 Tax=Streptomyces sp. NPDC038707 TaxID=3154329 RepID=UPI0033D60502
MDITLSGSVDRNKSIEDLEGERWPEPPQGGAGLVRSVHELRRRAVKDLSVAELRRLIGRNVGLRRLLPVALDHLRGTAPQEAATGWYDDDLLSAVLSRGESVWREDPRLARHLDETARMLTGLSPYIRREVEGFRAALADLLMP